MNIQSVFVALALVSMTPACGGRIWQDPPCGTTSMPPADAGSVCMAGEVFPCVCATGAGEGLSTCATDGSGWGACHCSSPPGTPICQIDAECAFVAIGDECSGYACDPTGQITQPGSSVLGCYTTPQPQGTACTITPGGVPCAGTCQGTAPPLCACGPAGGGACDVTGCLDTSTGGPAPDGQSCGTNMVCSSGCCIQAPTPPAGECSLFQCPEGFSQCETGDTMTECCNGSAMVTACSLPAGILTHACPPSCSTDECTVNPATGKITCCDWSQSPNPCDQP